MNDSNYIPGGNINWSDVRQNLDMKMDSRVRINNMNINESPKMMFNRSNSFPVSIHSNNEESYVVNFDQIATTGKRNEISTLIPNIRDANSIFLDDHISFIGSKETNSYFDNTSKYQRSVTTDFSNNLKYFGINCGNSEMFVNSSCTTPNYSRSNSDLSSYLEKNDKYDNSSDYSVNRSSGSTIGSLGMEFSGSFRQSGSPNHSLSPTHSIPPGSIIRYNNNDLTQENLNKIERSSKQGVSFSSLTSDQLRDIGFLNKQNNKRRSKRGYAPVKLFVNRVPKHMTNDELLNIFNKYGLVVECNIIKDSNGPRGCAFIRFSNIYEAQNAILCIHGKTILDKEVGPIQVKYADGEIERLGLSPDVQPCGESIKVFVGSLPKNCTEDQLLLLFKQFGHVDEVHIIRDNNKQSKCSAFVTFPRKFMAENAIMFLDKKYIFDNSKRPIEVRLAKSRAKQKQNQAQDQIYGQSMSQLSMQGINFYDSRHYTGNFALGQSGYENFEAEMNKQMNVVPGYNDVSAFSGANSNVSITIPERGCDFNCNPDNGRYEDYIGSLSCNNNINNNNNNNNSYTAGGFGSIMGGINSSDGSNNYIGNHLKNSYSRSTNNKNDDFYDRMNNSYKQRNYQTYSDFNGIQVVGKNNSTHSEIISNGNDVTTTHLPEQGGNKTSANEHKQILYSSNLPLHKEGGGGSREPRPIKNEEDLGNFVPSNLIDLWSKPILNI
ncbi:hypothetical protein FG379_000841 [Cryptosporidium bovis]|uniref:uncharacterized protein n=1 Tax=Cryptosporidium bovis TaxID=310047 RepID=UPI00351A7CEC|nr:hypothetical protein FG379_000841 [Cryptosporidium bovis]